MSRRKVGISVMVMGCILILSGDVAYSGDEPPLPPVPADYADKHMPAGWWTDPKVIAEGGKIYIGEINPLVNCASCHGKDGKPVKKGARDLRDPKNVGRFLSRPQFVSSSACLAGAPTMPAPHMSSVMARQGCRKEFSC